RQGCTTPARSVVVSPLSRLSPTAVLSYTPTPSPRFISDSLSNSQASTGSRRCIRSAITPKRGGLLSYGVYALDLVPRAADYVDRIMRGANPGELPVQAPTKFELVINF